MRVACLVYGRLNKSAEHYHNILSTLGDHEIDFFCSSDNSSEPLLNDFIRLYKPISYNNNSVEYTGDLTKYPGKRGETNLHTMRCHFINKNRVLSLLEEHINQTNMEYDCVVSMRIDCVFYKKFDFTTLQDNTIYIPYGSDWVDKGLNDQIAFGKIDVMRKYNSMNPVELLDKCLSIPHPESLNYANVHYWKLKIERPMIHYYIDR
jgi:hypothetical protein